MVRIIRRYRRRPLTRVPNGGVYFTERNGTERNRTQGYFTERTSVITERLLTLGAHAPEGYGSCPVCVSVCVCLFATLIWGLGLVEV